MRVALTGASGSVGRSLLPALLRGGHQVTAIDRRPWPGDLPAGASFALADLTVASDLAEAMQGCDGVVHLAGYPSPRSADPDLVYVTNVLATHRVLQAAVSVGVGHICLASSINAIGGAFSRRPRYDYFPLDEEHPCYVEDVYGLSKWVGEQDAGALCRRHPDLCVASLRFHFVVPDRQFAVDRAPRMVDMLWRHLWGYVTADAVNRAVLAALSATWRGHEVFYVVASDTVDDGPSEVLQRSTFPEVPVRKPFVGNSGFFDCSKAAAMLGWSP